MANNEKSKRDLQKGKSYVLEKLTRNIKARIRGLRGNNAFYFIPTNLGVLPIKGYHCSLPLNLLVDFIFQI